VSTCFNKVDLWCESSNVFVVRQMSLFCVVRARSGRMCLLWLLCHLTGVLDWLEVDIGARAACSLRLICVLSLFKDCVQGGRRCRMSCGMCCRMGM